MARDENPPYNREECLKTLNHCSWFHKYLSVMSKQAKWLLCRISDGFEAEPIYETSTSSRQI